MRGRFMMDFLQLAKKRYSVRKYKDKPVEEEKLAKILEAAHVAPTGANKQPVRLIVVREKEGLEKLAKGARFYNAPLVIIVCCDKTKTWKRPYDGKVISDIDASILTDHMMLQATELGLGTLWMCWFKEEIIREEFNIPDGVEPVNLLAVGYADCEDADPDRHSEMRIPLEELVSYESY